MGGPGSGKKKSKKIMKAIPKKRISNNANMIANDIMDQVKFRCPWIMSPIREETVIKLNRSIAKIIDNYIEAK